MFILMAWQTPVAFHFSVACFRSSEKSSQSTQHCTHTVRFSNPTPSHYLPLALMKFVNDCDHCRAVEHLRIFHVHFEL